MPKTARRYLDIDPWVIQEGGALQRNFAFDEPRCTHSLHITCFSFRLQVGESGILNVQVNPQAARFSLSDGDPHEIEVLGRAVTVTTAGISVAVAAPDPILAGQPETQTAP